MTYLSVDETGKINLEDLENSIRPDTILISIMFANNEIGTIQPIREIGTLAKKHNIIFHTDAVQAFGQIPIQVGDYNIDMLSASAHKLGGPKGVGLLYIRKGIPVGSFLHGGAQERKRRAGTENVAGIAGFSKAVSLAQQSITEKAKKEILLRDYLIDRILNEIPFSKLNGHIKDRLPGNANFSFNFIEGESILMMLDIKGSVPPVDQPVLQVP